MSKRTHLQDAKDRKDDEFYTRFEDIEKELGSYDWSNKIVACPADSEESEFIRFFKTRAKDWQLLPVFFIDFFPVFLYNICIKKKQELENNENIK